MLLSVVYPICDLRAFQPPTVGTAPLVGAGHPAGFVPWFGPARHGDGASGVFVARNAVRIRRWPLGDAPGPFRCVQRELTTRGEVASRFDLSIATRRDARARLPAVAEILQRFRDMRLSVPQQPRRVDLDLAEAALALARAYAEATTPAAERARLGPDVVTSADPAFFVVWCAEEGLSEEGLPPLAPVPDWPSLSVGRAPVLEAGATSSVWFLREQGSRNASASNLGAAIADSWVQGACLRLALRQLADGRLSPPPNPPEARGPAADPLSPSNRLQRYLTDTVALTERLGRSVPVSTAPLRFPDGDAETRDPAMPGVEKLRGALARIDVRPAVARKVTGWAVADASAGEMVPVPSLPAPGERALSLLFFPEMAEAPLPALDATLFTTLSARGRERVEPGDRVVFDVHLQLDRALPDPGPAGKSGAVPFTIPEGVVERRLHLQASSRDFVPLSRDTWSTTVLLRREGPSPSQWSFEAMALGDRPQYTFSVAFMLDSDPAGTLAVTLSRRGAAGAEPPPPRAEATLSVGAQGGPSAGVQIDIVYEGNVPVVKWRSRSVTGRPWEIRFDTTEHWNALGEEPYQQYGGLLGYGQRLGAEIDQDLFDALAGNGDGGTVSIVSPVPLFPFELVPMGRNKPFLGAFCSFARWISRPDVRPPEAGDIVVRGVACIRPEYTRRPLDSAKLDEASLGRRFPGLVRAGTRAEIDALLEREDIGLVHYAGHAEDNPPKLLLAGNDVLWPSDLRGTPLAKRRPFLFLNGCRAAMAHTGLPPSLGNMIEVLLASRLGGIVAPFITVDSQAAARAAEAFYDAAFGGSTIAEAVRAVHRLAETDGAHAATYLSYLAYTKPSLRLALEQASI